ncbi:MAG TPA: sugar phosphate nucleotidyltransferase [Sedimentisphaerales bacterium]|nr:sugar phosphate nucleotidyltransferase [Sedimentisphaerales bacterium]
MDKAVILARGLGTRMRKASGSAALSREQEGIAATGVKAMIPALGRPFLDYVLSGLADAGYKSVCLVIGPEHDIIRDYYSSIQYRRLSVSFAVQQEPRGTADAVAPARDFAGSDDFIVINSDNYYPAEALKGLRELNEAGLAGFERDALIAGSNIPAERIAKFACIEAAGGVMKRIIEKPAQEVLEKMPRPIVLSMNCWRFSEAIFEGCANIKPSPRGELELTDAVQYTIDNLAQRYRIVQVSAGVLDLSSREDIGPVVERLKGIKVVL